MLKMPWKYQLKEERESRHYHRQALRPSWMRERRERWSDGGERVERESGLLKNNEEEEGGWLLALNSFSSDDRSFTYQSNRPQLTQTTSRSLHADDRSSKIFTNDASFPLYPNDRSFDTHERHAVWSKTLNDWSSVSLFSRFYFFHF